MGHCESSGSLNGLSDSTHPNGAWDPPRCKMVKVAGSEEIVLIGTAGLTGVKKFFF